MKEDLLGSCTRQEERALNRHPQPQGREHSFQTKGRNEASVTENHVSWVSLSFHTKAKPNLQRGWRTHLFPPAPQFNPDHSKTTANTYQAKVCGRRSHPRLSPPQDLYRVPQPAPGGAAGNAASPRRQSRRLGALLEAAQQLSQQPPAGTPGSPLERPDAARGQTEIQPAQAPAAAAEGNMPHQRPFYGCSLRGEPRFVCCP